jgi:hypothetical protein
MIPGGRVQPFVQPPDALARIGYQGPKIGRVTNPRVLETIADCGDRRHQRLQDEAESHPRVCPRYEVVPDALEDWDRNTSPYDADHNQHKDGSNDSSRARRSSFRGPSLANTPSFA